MHTAKTRVGYCELKMMPLVLVDATDDAAAVQTLDRVFVTSSAAVLEQVLAEPELYCGSHCHAERNGEL